MNKKTRNIIIIVAILLVVGMAVAYAAISQTLTINGTARVKGNVGVIITNISESGSFTAEGTDTTATSFTDTTATFDATLSEPGETATYIVTVQNKGNVEAILKQTNYKVGASAQTATSVNSIDEVNSADPSAITFEVTGPTTNPLPVDGTATYTVVAKWDSAATNLNPDSLKTMVMELVYEQSI